MKIGGSMDTTSKVIFAAIALGLWANAMTSMLPKAQAQRGDPLVFDLGTISASLNSIARALDLLDRKASDIATGTCTNRKLC